VTFSFMGVHEMADACQNLESWNAGVMFPQVVPFDSVLHFDICGLT